MRRRFMAAIVLPGALTVALPLAAQQQSAPPQQQDQTTPSAPAPQKPTPKKKPSTAEQNPFPESQSEAAAHPSQQQDSAPSNPQNAPDAPQPATNGSKPADRNPFPESQSENAQRSQEQGQSAQPGDAQKPAPQDSGKAPQDYSSSHLKLLDLPGDKADPDTQGVNGHNPTLATKDTQVGLFYLKTGDYRGAYSRFAEATKADPGNADAVFGLAECARRLNQRDEAVRNYQLYLSALPDGPHAKDSRKALKDLGVKPNS